MQGDIYKVKVIPCMVQGCRERGEGGRGQWGTCARGRVRLPEVTAADLSADDSFGTLQDVAWIALERHMIARLPAVPAARPVGGHARVVAGGRGGDCKEGEMTEAQTPGDPSVTWVVCVCWVCCGNIWVSWHVQHCSLMSYDNNAGLIFI